MIKSSAALVALLFIDSLYTCFSDLIVGETTCDSKKKMYELPNRIKAAFQMVDAEAEEIVRAIAERT